MPPKDKEEAVVLTVDNDNDKQKDESKIIKKQQQGGDATDDDVAGMSEEDRELKERLETCVATVLLKDATSIPIRIKALDVIVTELRTATASMTSVPKPLKFLRPHYNSIQALYELLRSKKNDIDNDNLEFRARVADVLAVLAMTMGKPEERESLHYKLQAFGDYDVLKSRKNHSYDDDNLGCWGHEFVRSLAGEIGTEYAARLMDGDKDDPNTFVDLIKLVDVIVPFHITHNAEAEAVDLLIEVQQLSKLLQMTQIDESNFGRICLYLVKTADYMSDPDDYVDVLETAYEIYRKQGESYDALRVALKLNRHDESSSSIKQLLKEAKDSVTRKQMCILLGRHGVNYEVEEEDVEDDEEVELLNELIGNDKLSEQFLKLAQDLDVMDPKTPQDIYKSHLAETGGFSRARSSSSNRNDTTQVDSARANLASTFVNAFVNAGFGQDKLITPDSAEWLYKNKDHGMLSAAASLGCILLWNVEEGLTSIDKYLYSSEEYIKAGAALGVGILSCGVRNDADPALALLTEHVVDSSSHVMKCAACTGLGIAYAGSGREDVMELLIPVVEQASGAGVSSLTTMLEVSLAGLALGMIFVGKCNDTVCTTIVQRLMEATEEELNHSHARYLCLGLALVFLAQKEKAEAMIEALKTIEHGLCRKYAVMTLETCAFAASGNVLKVQEMLHQCAEHLTEDAEHQMAAVIGIGMITMGEAVGSEMALRTFDHLLHYCELPIKRAVPLALACLHISNPDFAVIDQLSRLSHDPDAELSQNAILALGMTSAGTNNSRVAGLLRQLSEFYSKDASHVFCVRIAQGLLHMGKGLLTIHPFHSDKELLNGPALAACLVLLHSCIDLKNTILDKSHYLLYYLTCAMNPRMLITLDEHLNWKPTTVRVGQAVETVGQAGNKPKRITGFQTHTSPVLLATAERAELATNEFLATHCLEGLVILTENPEWEDVDETTKK